jgi:hypothetical protein
MTTRHHTALTAPNAKARAAVAIGLIKARRTNSRAFANCFEMGDQDDVIREILARAEHDPEIERRYPHVSVWRHVVAWNREASSPTASRHECSECSRVIPANHDICEPCARAISERQEQDYRRSEG